MPRSRPTHSILPSFLACLVRVCLFVCLPVCLSVFRSHSAADQAQVQQHVSQLHACVAFCADEVTSTHWIEMGGWGQVCKGGAGASCPVVPPFPSRLSHTPRFVFRHQVSCRRVQIMRYFGEEFDARACKGTCDNCRDPRPVETLDLTDLARDTLRCVPALPACLPCLPACLPETDRSLAVICVH